MKNLSSLEKACTIFFIFIGAIIMILFFHNMYCVVLAPLFQALSFSAEGLFCGFVMILLTVFVSMLFREIYLTAKTFNS